MRQGLRWLLHEEAFTRFAARHPHLRGLDFVEQALTELHFDYRVSEAELEHILASGRVILVANHPIGSSTAGPAAPHRAHPPRRQDSGQPGAGPARAAAPLLLPVDNLGARPTGRPSSP
jgi:hypothetical protein